MRDVRACLEQCGVVGGIAGLKALPWADRANAVARMCHAMHAPDPNGRRMSSVTIAAVLQMSESGVVRALAAPCPKPRPTVHARLDAALEATGIDYDDAFSRAYRYDDTYRSRRRVELRRTVWREMRRPIDGMRPSYPEIASVCGMKSHTTIVEACHGKRRRRVPAFTISELLAVVVILAVLLSVALPALRQSRERAQADRCMADLRSIRDIAVIYHDHNHWRWPRRIEQLGLDPGAPLVCVRDRTPDPERSHDLWAPSIGMAIGTVETPTLESRVEQAAPPGLLMVSDIPLWCERQGVRRYGVWTGGFVGEVRQ